MHRCPQATPHNGSDQLLKLLNVIIALKLYRYKRKLQIRFFSIVSSNSFHLTRAVRNLISAEKGSIVKWRRQHSVAGHQNFLSVFSSITMNKGCIDNRAPLDRLKEELISCRAALDRYFCPTGVECLRMSHECPTATASLA